MTAAALVAWLAWGAPPAASPPPPVAAIPRPADATAVKLTPATDDASLRARALEALEAARRSPAAASAVVHDITLPSIERLIQDADARAASITVPERDHTFVRETLVKAYGYALQVAAGDDPYRLATGMVVKAYRAEWDGTLQPYALYVPRDYKPGRPGGWPLIVALHGAFSDHRHNLRRVFGLDNRPRESDAEDEERVDADHRRQVGEPDGEVLEEAENAVELRLVAEVLKSRVVSHRNRNVTDSRVGHLSSCQGRGGALSKTAPRFDVKVARDAPHEPHRMRAGETQ